MNSLIIRCLFHKTEIEAATQLIDSIKETLGDSDQPQKLTRQTSSELLSKYWVLVKSVRGSNHAAV
jgi:hypothetical protein